MPRRTDPVSLLAEKVSAQIRPALAPDRGIYVFAGTSLPLPSGRVGTPALVAHPSSEGPYQPLQAARTARLIVDVVADDADLAELEVLRAEYQTLPELLDYVRVGLTRRAVVVYSLRDGWQRHAFSRGIAPLPGIGAGLAVTALYR